MTSTRIIDKLKRYRRKTTGDLDMRAPWDEESFFARMFDYLKGEQLDEAQAEYIDATGRSFEEWLSNYINDDLRRAIVYAHSDYLFSWINDNFLEGSGGALLASDVDVQDNATQIREILEARIDWPLPFQGIRQAAEGLPVEVNAVYAEMDQVEFTPWRQYPERCMVSFVFRGHLYTGHVSDFNRKMEIIGVPI